METDNKLFPVFFRMDKIQLLMVGGGAVALEKLTALYKHCDNASCITIVAPEIRDEILQLQKKFPNQINLKCKPYEKADLKGHNLVISATNIRELNQVVYRDARNEGVLCNVADMPDICDFYLGSVVKKGSLKLAISTNGKSPTFAKRMREWLEAIIPENTEHALDELNEIRAMLKEDFEEKIKKLDEITSVLKPSGEKNKL
ncbi:MAG: bifunctional precorrin-2 dehydrogenase/sirohydrochlorin ferrochelatase [Cytophagaceae bacterium]|nr:bifunctional precorrin-2 dehydrogenase/sirohydrochlorin ferrochelatase [Cytophagaceae bacterium]MDW8456440.1 bifunctional precorrin-2 dehydrogenase/sirohydrochlorin ferrochelatase [Cytophagaceae bacterium]